MINRSDTIPLDVAPVEIAQRRQAPLPENREVVFDVQDSQRSVRHCAPPGAAR